MRLLFLRVMAPAGRRATVPAACLAFRGPGWNLLKAAAAPKTFPPVVGAVVLFPAGRAHLNHHVLTPFFNSVAFHDRSESCTVALYSNCFRRNPLNQYLLPDSSFEQGVNRSSLSFLTKTDRQNLYAHVPVRSSPKLIFSTGTSKNRAIFLAIGSRGVLLPDSYIPMALLERPSADASPLCVSFFRARSSANLITTTPSLHDMW